MTVPPMYTHDCARCRFLGTGRVEEMGHPVDWYSCGTSVIARYADAGHSYWSSPVAMLAAMVQCGDKWARAAVAVLYVP